MDQVRVISGDTADDALWRRHLGVARRRHRRRGGVAGRQGAARRTSSRSRARSCRREPEHASTSATAPSSTRRPGASACRSRSSAASSISGPTRCRRASSPNSWRPGTTCRRTTPSPSPTASRPPTSRSTPRPASCSCSSTGASRIAAPILNPLLVDEQIRGGIVQGIGGALFEHCLYDERGPAPERHRWPTTSCRWRARCPTSRSRHVVSPTASSEIGAKGAGEAGTAGAPAAVVNAINDALAPFGARVSRQPVTPERGARGAGTGLMASTSPHRRESRLRVARPAGAP